MYLDEFSFRYNVRGSTAFRILLSGLRGLLNKFFEQFFTHAALLIRVDAVSMDFSCTQQSNETNTLGREVFVIPGY